MGVRIFLSNDQEKLAQHCARNLSVFKSIFRPVNIVTQTAGMNRWLSVKLAEINGQFCHFNFLTPNGLVNYLFEFAGLRSEDIFETENARWIIFKLLEENDFKERYPDVSKYYKDNDVKRLQLATRIADRFDQYAVYRPDMITEWNQNKEFPFARRDYIQHERWQRYLWVKMTAQLGTEKPDRVRLKDEFLKKLQEPHLQEKLKADITGITLFGLSLLTEYHLEVIHALGAVIQIDLYFLNPAPFEFWYDNKDENLISYIEKKTNRSREELYLEIGNSLLANLGKAGQNSFSVFLNDTEFINVIDDSMAVEPKVTSLLSHIQSDIFHNRSLQERSYIPGEMLMDGSLIISSSFTLAREVEAVYNYLLTCFETNPDLKPHEIIVMTSDIDKYSPFIKAVFDSAPLHMHIPYSIADRSYESSQDLFGVFETFINFNPDNLTAEDMLDLAQMKLIRSRFELDDHDFERELLDQLNIRHGISGNKEDHSHLVSWSTGLEKIAYSYAMADEVPYEGEQSPNYTIKGLEGEAGRNALRFCSFALTVIDLIRERKQNRSLQDWKVYFENVLEQLVHLRECENDELNRLQFHLSRLVTSSFHMDRPVPFDVLRSGFLSSIFQNKREGHFLNGKVTFSSMIPMRSIPFKVVAILGLDRDKFPRKTDKFGFDLMQAKRRKSDRNVRDNDKYLFLESILSARDKFYVSYIGQDPISGAQIQPSVVVDELVDYISQKCENTIGEVASLLVEKQPLHSFGHGGSGSMYTGAIERYKGLNLLENHEEIEDHQGDIIPLTQMVRFFQDPFKYFFQRTLGIYLDERETTELSTELFELGSLDSYHLKQEILSPNFAAKQYIDKGEKTGQLPLNQMAAIPVKVYQNEMQKLLEALNQEIASIQPSAKSLEVRLSSYTLVSDVLNCYQNKIYIPHVSGQASLRRKEIELCILALMLDAAETPMDLFIVDLDGKISQFNAKKLSSSEAIDSLEYLTSTLKEGINSILHFLPTALQAFRRQKDTKDIMDSIRLEGLPSSYRNWHNPYVELAIKKGTFNRLKQADFETLERLLSIFTSYDQE